MKLSKVLLGAIAAVAMFGQATASACYVPVCKPNPSNCGPKPEVSDCGGGHHIPKHCKKCGGDHDDCDGHGHIKIVIIIIKIIFGGKGC